MNNNVNLQAERLGEAILGSEQYISMRLSEQAVIDDDEAQRLIQTYSEHKDAFQKQLSQKPMDHEAMAKAGEVVKESEEAVSKHLRISAMREKSAEYQDMMHQVNDIIARIINGEPEDGCSGSCEGCGGSCGH